MDAVTQYANQVVAKEMVAGKWVQLACERHLRDLDRQDTEDDFPYLFDESRAERVFSFFRFCKHTKGKLAGSPIDLDPFQKFILGSIFGWVHHESGLRRYRKAYIQLARKNAKSTILSGVGLYMLMADGEAGAEIYATATKSDQARIIYGDSKVMVNRSRDLSKRLNAQESVIRDPRSNSVFRPLSKDTKTLDGLNPYLGIIDEYHAHPTSEMYDVLVSGMGQRAQPLLFIITTAGFNIHSPCYTEYEYCTKIMESTLDNDQYFVYIAEMDEDDDIGDERTWVKANPLLAQSEEGIAYLKAEYQVALDVPEKMRNFLTKNINKWVDMKENGYLSLSKWKDCSEEEPIDLTGRECYIGIDLSRKIDLTSIGFVFPLENGRFVVRSHSFLPEDTLRQKRHTDKVPYDLWVRDQWIAATDGSVVDYRYIMKYIQDQVITHGWKVLEVCFDPYNATHFAQEMEAEGYTVLEIRQGYQTLSEPTKDFRELVLSKKIIHDNNPVLTWAISNAVTRQDHNENIMLDKDKSTNRIDPIAALLNAHVRARLRTEGPSIYEGRGLLTL
ncbi:Phage terminase-like protein, large subunit, contains N-terminal HTH domain [Marininema mesophilum]|uniref:Phage terminase-like protein, large subunit, contains N-terminal HTH domain n=1 Tax=Marininema mesophilum TaxID=1048340 RepID=A0A1H3BU68_9BACL|nr:terminase TerL endonuclease subunit [Marininema mesophilum]SDX45366.1 Phage terminase-like protein, large subunit, contains N-terminal HTH domain [Marininema mesophilum]